MVPETNPEQVERACAGDAEAQSALWCAHRRFAAAVLLAHRPPGAEIQDLLQDVALSFVRGIGDLREPNRFRPWLRAIALNAARMAARRLGTRADQAVENGCSHPIAPASPHRGEPAEDERDEARRALDLAERLDPIYREPLLLRCLRGLSQAEIAAALELPETTVETRLARARRWLREAAERDAAERGAARERMPERALGAAGTLPR